MTTFTRETKGDDADVELYRGFVLARCGSRLCARLAEGYQQQRVAEFLQDHFYDQGVRAAVSEGRHITGAVCCALVDGKVKGLERQRALLKQAVDAFWRDFQGEGRFFLPSGSELHQQMAETLPAAAEK
ncbi:MAG: hypothetical protein HY681_12670 [Chloroflexi bacterium]|nr:hypothetical protein [Chloroflexota bacterium]